MSCPETSEHRNRAAVFECCAMSRRRGAFSAFEKTAQAGAVGGHERLGLSFVIQVSLDIA